MDGSSRNVLLEFNVEEYWHMPLDKIPVERVKGVVDYILNLSQDTENTVDVARFGSSI